MPPAFHVPSRVTRRSFSSVASPNVTFFGTDANLALLAVTPPTLSVRAFLRTSLYRQLRFIELRANNLLVFRSLPAPDLSNADTVIQIPSNTNTASNSSTSSCVIRKVRGCIIRICHLSFQFPHSQDAQALYDAIEDIVSGAAPARYTVHARLGRGASGMVYLASNDAHDIPLAIKTIPKAEALSSEIERANLVNEHQALCRTAEADTPFVLRILDAFETPRHFHFVLPLAAYGDLHHILSNIPGHAFPAAVARHIFAELVLAIHHLHCLGYLYRDLKPGNVLIDADGHVQLCDMGLVQRLRTSTDRFGKRKLSGRVRAFAGTRSYMAPEQLMSESTGSYGAPADVWGLGVVLYIMLTGEHPFMTAQCARRVNAQDGGGASDNNKLVWAMANMPFRVPPHLPAEAGALLRAMLRPDEQKRIDMDGIMRHPWMRDVEWKGLRTSARRGEKVDAVLDMMAATEVQLVSEVAKNAMVGDADEKEEMDMVTRELAKRCGDEKDECGGKPFAQDLLGFDFVGCVDR